MEKAATGIRSLAHGRSDVLRIHPEDLYIEPGWNLRDMDTKEALADLKELAESIKEHGVKEPLSVMYRDGKAMVTNGHRRLRAIALLKKQGHEVDLVPVRTEDKESTEADLVLAQIVRNSGKPFGPLETARVYKRLQDLGMKVADIARTTGKSRVWVSQLLDLLSAPEEVTALVTEGKVSPTLAAEQLKKNKGDGEQTKADLTKAVEQAASEGKEKASAKHLKSAKEKEPKEDKKSKKSVDQAKRDSPIEALGKLWDRLNLSGSIEGDGDKYVINLTANQYAEMRVIAGR